MALDYEHCGDHAAVSLSGDLTVEAVLQLVNLVDVLIDNYFYTRVDLAITSPGGSTQAAAPFLSALARWRSRGVVLCTRVHSSASSMAAFFFALGDVRVADPHARILFHCSRIMEARDITVADTVRMYSTLRALDRTHVKRLAARALRTSVPRPAAPDSDDRALVASLFRALSLDGAGRSHKWRVRALARYVDRAVRMRDRRALKALYGALLREEASLSPRLACTLALADVVLEPLPASVNGGASADASAPALVIPEWCSLYPPHGAVPRAALTRHVLAMGETGSGKTASAICPILAALARAPRQQVRGGLIIDPKCELDPVLRALVGDGLQTLDRSDLVVDLMDAPEWSVNEDVAAKRWVTIATAVLLRMRGFAPASPLRVLGPHESESSNSEFFDREGSALLRDLVAFILMLLDPDAPPTCEWFSKPRPEPVDSSEDDELPDIFDRPMLTFAEPETATPAPAPTSAQAWVEALHARARGLDGGRGLNVVALADWALGTPLVQVRDYDVPWLWAQLATAVRPVFGGEAGESRDLLGRITAYWRKSSEIGAQHMGVIASARNAAHEFSVPSVASSVYFGCEPGLASEGGTRVDFAGLVACGADPSGPRFVLYQPARDGADSLVGACLKARFFESLFLDSDRQTGRPDLPLVVYAADEAQAFLTSDAIHGEPHLLESSRSFGCVVVLATQSLQSIERTLSQRGGTPTERSATVDIVWINTGTKLTFRSTDERTTARVQELTPYRPGHAPITRVRPLSALPPGACYAFLPDGTFGLHQLAPFDADALARAPSGVSDAAPVTPLPEARRRKKAKRRKGPRSKSSRAQRSRRSGASSESGS